MSDSGLPPAQPAAGGSPRSQSAAPRLTLNAPVAASTVITRLALAEALISATTDLGPGTNGADAPGWRSPSTHAINIARSNYDLIYAATAMDRRARGVLLPGLMINRNSGSLTDSSHSRCTMPTNVEIKAKVPDMARWARH